MGTIQTGQLFIVATPIGNLADITHRAVQILKSVDLIAAEDTRHSRFLLTHLGINKPMVSLHDFNEAQRTELLITELQQGKNIALISDAGTPLISDPGFVMVNKARKANITVSPIPGPCAAIAALCASGLPTDQFVFAGFLANKTSARKAQLEKLQQQTGTLVFYEAPHRLKASLKDMESIFGAECEMVIARELTKAHETFYTGSIAQVMQQIEQDPFGATGEFVILAKGIETTADTTALSDHAKNIVAILGRELPIKQAAQLAAEISGESKNLLYEHLLNIKKKS